MHRFQSDSHEGEVARRARALVARLAATIGVPAAVAWVHATAVAHHAREIGLIPHELDRLVDAASALRMDVAALADAHPALEGWVDPEVNPMWTATPDTADVNALHRLWQTTSVVPVRSRPDGTLIGDLYEALSGEARRTRGLAQPPKGVIDRLLDLSQRPAFEKWGVDAQTIDPACGTGHILVEALVNANATRLAINKRRHRRVLAALGSVHGLDVDPYAALVARYRLVAMTACLLGTPAAALPQELPIHVTVADAFASDDKRGHYHAVVTTPPQISCTDHAIRMQYPRLAVGRLSLAAAFEPLMHELCVDGGWVARLTAAAFMKPQLNKHLTRDYFPTIALERVIATGDAAILGMPSVILASRNAPPNGDAVRLGTGLDPR